MFHGKDKYGKTDIAKKRTGGTSQAPSNTLPRTCGFLTTRFCDPQKISRLRRERLDFVVIKFDDVISILDILMM
jgi:hypothetical protein